MSSLDEAARSAALLAPATDLGTLTVSGSERLSWLQGILTNDVGSLRAGEGSWGLLLTRQGKILADVLVVAGAEVTYLGIQRSALARAQEYLGTFLIMEDADLADSSAAFAWVHLHGPDAARIAASIAPLAGAEAANLDVTGLGGAAIVVPRQAETSVREAAIEAGAVAATDEDYLRLRVERLVPEYGVDMDEHRSPHEVSLERRTVSWTKGCYLGQEAVCMQDMRGKVKRRLSLVKIDAAVLPAAGTKVLDQSGATVGETRSAVRSNLVGAPVAMAFLNAAAAVTGTRLTVDGAGAEVVELR